MLTLAFVAQFAVYALSLHAIDDVRVHAFQDEPAVVARTGTVLQMPAGPSGDRAQRAAAATRTARRVAAPAAAVAKPARSGTPAQARVRRPDPVDDEAAADAIDELRANENAVRITIIGPDGQPRTKVVRVSGSRDRMAAPARRPHD